MSHLPKKSDINAAWCLECFLSFFFPGKGKKGSIVQPHTSAEQQTGWLLCFLVGLLTNRNSFTKSYVDRRRMNQRGALFTRGRGYRNSCLIEPQPTAAAGSAPGSMAPGRSFFQRSEDSKCQLTSPSNNIIFFYPFSSSFYYTAWTSWQTVLIF